MNKNPRGHEFEYKTIKASEIKFDETYQRPINEKKVRDAVKRFNGDIFNEPKVSFRPGDGYYSFDGRRSTAIWQAYHNNPDQPITVKVFYGMSWDDEVEAFIQQFGEKEDVARSYILRAKYNRGDPEIVDMVEICKELGWEIDFENAKVGENRICAVVTLADAYDALGPNKFKEMMAVIREAYGGSTDAVQKAFLIGMKDFYKFFYGEFKRIDLISTLKRVSPLLIIRDGKAKRESQSHPYANEIAVRYNKGRSKQNKVDTKRL